MRILVLGGTQFLGRHVVEHALGDGHDVTLFNRGQTRPELFPEVERLRGDRDGALDELRGRDFDAVVDTSCYVPRIVRETIEALGDVGHYTFVSSISVYADVSTPPDESSPVKALNEPTEEWREAYGELKAQCEDVVRERYPDAFVVRPGLIVGPWDPTGRFTYWPERLAEGGRVLAAAPVDADAQVIDVRDLASWIVRAAEDRLAGTINAVDRRGRAVRSWRRSSEPSTATPSSCGSTATSSPSTRSASGWSCRCGSTRPSTAGCSRSTRPAPSRPALRHGRSRRRRTTRSNGCEAARRRPIRPRGSTGRKRGGSLTPGSRKSSFERSLSRTPSR
jgi:uncharacterized protein YbjT (DUF2867 family)